MMGKAIAYRDILLTKTLFKDMSDATVGPDYQFYILLGDMKSGQIKFEGVGKDKATAFAKFSQYTEGDKAMYYGVLFHADGTIHKISRSESQDPLHKGENDAYVLFSEYFMLIRKWFTSAVRSEKDAGMITWKVRNEEIAALKAERQQFAQRILTWGNTLMTNFNGTGYRFARNEAFIGIRYNTISSSINYWKFYARNMDDAYETFGRQISRWARRNFNNYKMEPEEYFLFGNNKLLLSSIDQSVKIDPPFANIRNAVIGYAFHNKLYMPDEGLLDPVDFKGYWSLLQDRTSNIITMHKCDGDWNICSK